MLYKGQFQNKIVGFFNPFTALPRVLLVIKMAYHMPIPRVSLMMNTPKFKAKFMVKGTKLNYPNMFKIYPITTRPKWLL